MRRRLSVWRGLPTVIAVAVISACATTSDDDEPQPATASVTQALDTDAPALTFTIPGSASVGLTVATVDQFIFFVAGALRSQASDVHNQIRAAECVVQTGTCAIVDALLAKLADAASKKDVGRQFVIITILGELGDWRARSALVNYVNEPAPSEPELAYDLHGYTQKNGWLMLRTRAVEAIAFPGTSDALDAVKAIALSHPEWAVRDSAVDGYIYNSPDPVAARSTIRALLPPADRFIADRFDKDEAMTPADYDAAITAYNALWPSAPPAEVELGPPPQVIPAPPPRPEDVVPFSCPPNVPCRSQ